MGLRKHISMMAIPIIPLMTTKPNFSPKAEIDNEIRKAIMARITIK